MIITPKKKPPEIWSTVRFHEYGDVHLMWIPRHLHVYDERKSHESAKNSE